MSSVTGTCCGTLRAGPTASGRDEDPKLAALADALAEIVSQADHDGVTDEDAREKRKVLIFTYFCGHDRLDRGLPPRCGG